MAQRTHRSPTWDAALASSCTSSNSDAASSPKSFTFADLVKAQRVAGVSLAVGDGETLVILGPSGAGKTSLLRLLAGLEDPDSGCIRLDGNDVTKLPARDRRVGLVSQDDSLFPHLTLYQNLAFPMRLRRTARAQIERAVVEQAKLLEIDRCLHVRPAHVSGGERQRAALARALLSNPRVILLDEPFAHLDPQLRANVRSQFRDARRRFSGAAIHVTHDHGEAMAIGDRLAIMIAGRIVQFGDPQTVYDSPASLDVARFFGSPPMNVLDDEPAIAGIRPEHVVVDGDGPLHGVVEETETIGPDELLRVKTPRGRILVRVLRDAGRSAPAPGSRIGLRFPPQFVRRFDRGTGLLIE